MIRRVGLAALSLLLTLGLLEGLTRLLYPGLRQPTFTPHPLYGWAQEPSTTYYLASPDTGETWRYETNGRGWKDFPHTLAKPAGVYRIVVVGDSNTWGLVPQGDEFPHQLQLELARRGHYTLEVVAIGVGGWAADQVLLAIQHEALLYAPDLIIYQWDYNDIQGTSEPRLHPTDSTSLEAAKALWALPDGSLEPHTPFYAPPPLSFSQRLPVQSSLAALLARPFTLPRQPEVALRASAAAPHYQVTEAEWQTWAAVVRRMAEAAGTVPLVVWSQEDKAKGQWWAYWGFAGMDTAAFNAHAARLIAPLPFWAPVREYERYIYDNHATAKGNRAMARDLADFWERDFGG